MKKFIFSLAAFAAIATACQVEDINETATPAGETFTITADIAATKTSLTVGEDGYKVDWEADDALSVVAKYADGGYAGYEFTKGEGNTFSGEVNNAANIEEVNVFYPVNNHYTSIDTDGYGSSYVTFGSTYNRSQSQNGIDNADHIGETAPLYGSAAVISDGTDVSIKHASTLLEVIVTNNSDIEITVSKIAVTNSEDKDMVGTFFINPKTGALKSSNTESMTYTSSTATLDVSNGIIAAGQKGKFYITSVPFELAANSTLDVTVTANGKSYPVVKTIPDAEHGKFVAGTVNHINVTLDEVQEAEKIEPGEYLIAAKTTKGWAVMTGTNQKSEYFDAETIETVTKPIESISCSDFYSIPTINEYVWTLETTESGYSLKNVNGYLSLRTDSDKDGKLTGYAEYSDELTSLSIIKEADGTFSIKGLARADELPLKYNSSSPRFKPYSGQTAVVLVPWKEDTTPRIFVAEPSKTVYYNVTTATFEYTTMNIEGDIEVSETSDENNIISAVTAKDGIVTATIIPNTEEIEKTATITLSYDGAESVVLTITQIAAPGADDVIYEKVTETPTDWSGQYLIVFEEAGRIFNGSLSSNFNKDNYVEVMIGTNEIVETEEVASKYVTLEKHGDNYAIKLASGFYLYNSSSTTVAGTETYSSDCDMTIAFSDGKLIIKSIKTNRKLELNENNIRFYVLTSDYQAPALYKRSK